MPSGPRGRVLREVRLMGLSGIRSTESSYGAIRTPPAVKTSEGLIVASSAYHWDSERLRNCYLRLSEQIIGATFSKQAVFFIFHFFETRYCELKHCLGKDELLSSH